MSWVPPEVIELIDVALVTELSVVRSSDGRPVTYPLIPFWDGERIVMTSSILFSRKLEHLKADPRVALSFSDPVALGGRTAARLSRARARPRRRPARRLGERPAALDGQGAGHRAVPEGARGIPALLRARRHRGHAEPLLLLAGRRHSKAPIVTSGPPTTTTEAVA